MPSPQKSHKSAMKLREEARGLLDRIDADLDGEDRRALAREAFELVRKAETIEPFCALAEAPRSEARARSKLAEAPEAALTVS